MRKNAEDRFVDLYGVRRNGDGEISELVTSSGHVNFFADLEEETRKNYGAGNKEYEEEKRKEREEYESKVGILKYLGEGSNEFTKVSFSFCKNNYMSSGVLMEEVVSMGHLQQKSWYDEVPKERAVKASEKKSKYKICGVGDIGERAESSVKKKRRKENKRHKHNKEEHSKKHKRRGEKHRYELPMERNANPALEKLRMERLKREEAERQRTAALLFADKKEAQEKNEKATVYNSQFNPELARQNFK